MNTARKSFSWRGLVVATLLAAVSAGADAFTLEQTFHLGPSDPTATLSLGAFDAGLGTLSGVSIDFNVTRRHAWGLWNLDGDGAAPRALDYSMSLAGSNLSVNGVNFAFADHDYGPASTAPLAGVTDEQLSDDLLSGYSRFVQGADPAFALAQNGGSLDALTFGGSLPFFHDGDLVLSYAPGVFGSLAFVPGTWTVEGAENAAGASFVDVFGSARVTYTYTPVPDSLSTGLWLGVVTLLAAVFRRK